jgi:hypothetical protein
MATKLCSSDPPDGPTVLPLLARNGHAALVPQCPFLGGRTDNAEVGVTPAADHRDFGALWPALTAPENEISFLGWTGEI